MTTTPPDNAVTAHLSYLEQRGHTEASVYARWRALTRLRAWLAAYADIPGPESGRADKSHLRRAVAEVGLRAGDLLTATAADLAAWRASLTTGPGATVNYVSHVQNFYAWCIEQGLRGDNPAAGLPVPRLPRRLPRPIREDDLMRALAAAGDRVRPWLILAVCCGMRAREIALLRRENVLDTDRDPAIRIAAAATKGHTERIVPLPAVALAELRRAGLPASGWVFRRRDGRPGPVRPHLVSQLTNRALHRSGTPATLHQLRHLYLTLVQRERHDLRLTQHLAGHASPATTAIYTEVDWADAAAVAEAVAESLPVPGRLRVARSVVP